VILAEKDHKRGAFRTFYHFCTDFAGFRGAAKRPGLHLRGKIGPKSAVWRTCMRSGLDRIFVKNGPKKNKLPAARSDREFGLSELRFRIQ
jgi:hypothetical protein